MRGYGENAAQLRRDRGIMVGAIAGFQSIGGATMGQYYKFVNTTQKKESTISLPFNFGLSRSKNLETVSEKELKEQFDYVIRHNHWSQDDEVIAIGDYCHILYYPGGQK